MNPHESTEASPLLPKRPEYLRSSHASEETLTDYAFGDSLTDEISWATPPEHNPPEYSSPGPEQTSQNQDDDLRIEGLPEVRKKFIYIVPAITLGVSE